MTNRPFFLTYPGPTSWKPGGPRGKPDQKPGSIYVYFHQTLGGVMMWLSVSESLEFRCLTNQALRCNEHLLGLNVCQAIVRFFGSFCMCAHMRCCMNCAHVCKRPEADADMSSSVTSPYFSRHGFSLNLELIWSASLAANKPQDPPIPAPHSPVPVLQTSMVRHVGAGEPNSGPQACTGCTLSAGPSC